MNLLTVEGLQVSFPLRTRVVEAVRGVSFAIGREKVGLVGESGSGKSMTGRAILRLVPPPGRVTAARLAFHQCYGPQAFATGDAGEARSSCDVDLLRASERTIRGIRGRRISMVLQDPRFSLNPVLTIGTQIAEAYRAHHRASRAAARERALEMLRAVQIRDPERVHDAYPHELSGGMGQRAMIAMMLVPEPDLLIADEPTSSLDATVQLQVLGILDDLVTRRGMGLLFISHDLKLVGSFCDRVLVMYGGRIVETLAAADLHKAAHPYTRGLLAALPGLARRGEPIPVLERDPAWLTS
jgi:peptide/nickel transport system ATP-binding protein